jgi:hypothetical protein
MASYKPISGTAVQEIQDNVAASGYYLKGYQAGTTTALAMGIDSTPTSTLAKCALDSQGRAINGSSAVFIPHFNADYKLVLYANSTDADADTFANAVWTVDNISISDSNQSGWLSNGYTVTRIANTSFNTAVADGDLTAEFSTKRRLRFTDNGNTYYGEVIKTDYNSTVTNATYVLCTDIVDSTFTSQSLTANLTAVDLSIIPHLSTPHYLLFYTPEMFGCTGDGVVDDTTNFQAAIDYCGSNRKKLVAYGEYLVSSTLTFKRSGRHSFTMLPAVEISSSAQHGIYWNGANNSTIVQFETCQQATFGTIVINNNSSKGNGATGMLGAVFRDPSNTGAAGNHNMIDRLNITGCQYGARIGDYTNDGYDSNIEEWDFNDLYFFDCDNPLLIDSDSLDLTKITRFYAGGNPATGARDYLIRVLRNGNGLYIHHGFGRANGAATDTALIDIRDGSIKWDFFSIEGEGFTCKYIDINNPLSRDQSILNGFVCSDSTYDSNGVCARIQSRSGLVLNGCTFSADVEVANYDITSTNTQFSKGVNGSHDGSANSATLDDSSASWTASQWVGYTIRNQTDGSSGVITANTSSQITVTLTGGTDNDWDSGDIYLIEPGFKVTTGATVEEFNTRYREENGVAFENATARTNINSGNIIKSTEFWPSAKYNNTAGSVTTILDSTATKLCTILLDTNSAAAVVVMDVFFWKSSGTAMAGTTATVKYAMCRDSAGNITVATPTVTDNVDALDGVTAPSLSASTTTNGDDVELEITQTSGQILNCIYAAKVFWANANNDGYTDGKFTRA